MESAPHLPYISYSSLVSVLAIPFIYSGWPDWPGLLITEIVSAFSRGSCPCIPIVPVYCKWKSYSLFGVVSGTEQDRFPRFLSDKMLSGPPIRKQIVGQDLIRIMWVIYG